MNVKWRHVTTLPFDPLGPGGGGRVSRERYPSMSKPRGQRPSQSFHRDSARVTNGPFLSHKGTERERCCAGVAEFRRERRLSLRTTLTGNRWFPTGCATTLQIAENWQPIVSLGHRRFARPAYVRLCVKSERSVTSGLMATIVENYFGPVAERFQIMRKCGMTTELQKLLEKRASTAGVNFESIDPGSNYTAILDFFLRTVVDAAIADGAKLETLAAILIGCVFHAMDEESPSGMASKADSDMVLKIVQAQHARISKLHDPAYIARN